MCLLHNYGEIILWFAASYLFFAYEIKLEDGVKLSLVEAIFSSFLMMVGEPAIRPSSNATYLPIMVLGQGLIGLFMTLLSLARFISLIPTPPTHDETEAEQALSQNVDIEIGS